MVFSAMRRLSYVYGVPSLDNFVLKLYYRWTVLILVVFSLIITCKLLFGYSIYCSSAIVSDTLAAVKCYGSELYNLPATVQNGPYEIAQSDRTEDKRHYMNYYSWVNMLFLVHAFNFYLPHLLWKSYERGYMHKLTAGIQMHVDKEEKRDLELCRLAKYVFTTQGKHKLYILLYILSEIFNLVISLSHALWLVSFFNVTAVPDSIPYDFNTTSDFKNYYFPREGYCNFKRIGSSGVFQTISSVCELPLNDLYMPMYLFLKVWYIAITVLTILMIIYRICLLIPSVRACITRMSSPLSPISILTPVCYRMSYTDWIFLSRLQYAMTDVDFAHMINKIAIVAQEKDPQSDDFKRFTALDDTAIDLNSSNFTSPL